MIDFSLGLFFDPLSLFFVATILLISFPVFIYSFDYLKGHNSPAINILLQVTSVLFVLAMLLVVSTRNVFIFLIAWELMSLLSYSLLFFESDGEKSVRAGSIYLVMTHVGTAFLVTAFFLMYKFTHSFDLLIIKEAVVALPGGTKNILFLLLLAGFGTKAGIVPLHIWLPYAHPQAPSHISALMSGVMIKTAIYGILRFVFFTLGIDSLWWGELVLVLAIVSSLVGVIYALIEHDLKTLLAYCSVENIGVILFGVGASMVFIKTGQPILAVIALSAGLYHLLNHAVFKGLLFLCAGSVYKATGTRDLEKLGGLIKRLPWTASFFLIGAMAISALPPLNGFVSEWLTLMALFWGVLALTGGLKIFLALCTAALALAGGLAAACFVKAFGLAFLARPRSQKAETAQEVPFLMNLAAGLLAGVTILLGLGAALIFRQLVLVAGWVVGLDTTGLHVSSGGFLINPQLGQGSYLATPLLALLLIGVIGGTLALIYICFGRPKVTVRPTWDCGYYRLLPRNEYTATAFSKPFRLAFSFFLLPYHRTQKIKESHYHVKSYEYKTETVKIFRQFVYAPFVGLVFNAGRSLKKAQPGSIHLYLSYILTTLLVLLIIKGWL